MDNLTKNSASYTNESKNSATYTNVDKSGGLVGAFNLLIDSTYQLLIGGSENLLIQKAGAAWNNLTKN